jgi:hypothetical protein
VHVLFGGPQHPHGLVAFGRHSPGVPSALKHGAGLHVPGCWSHGPLHGRGQFTGSHTALPGHGWVAEHGIAGTRHPPLPRQNPQAQWPVAALQSPSGTAEQPAGHCAVVSKHPAPGQLQQSGGGMQSHLSGAVRWHCDPGGAVAGQGPLQPVGDAESK